MHLLHTLISILLEINCSQYSVSLVNIIFAKHFVAFNCFDFYQKTTSLSNNFIKQCAWSSFSIWHDWQRRSSHPLMVHLGCFLNGINLFRLLGWVNLYLMEICTPSENNHCRKTKNTTVIYLIIFWLLLPQPNQQHKTKQNNLVGVVF